MPPIYTINPVGSKFRPDPLFKARGITGEPGILSSMNYNGLPHLKQIAYDSYRSNIASFLQATALQTRVKTSKQMHNVRIHPSKVIHFPFPQLAFNPVNEKTFMKSLEALGLDSEVEEVQYRAGSVYICSEMTLDRMKKFSAEGLIKQNSEGPVGSCSLIGMKAYLSVWKIITLFLATQTYPAFPEEDFDVAHMPYVQDVEYAASGSSLPINNKKRGYQIIGAAAREQKTSRLEKYFQGHDKIDEVDAMDAGEGHYSASSGKDCLVAKPAPFYPYINFGPPSAIPAMPGLYFGYFPGMLGTDASIVTNIIGDHFLLTLGETKEEIQTAFAIIKKGSGQWCSSEVGKRTAHVLFGIKLALESQTRMYVISEGDSYHGFCLLGHHFSVVTPNLRHGIISSEEIMASIESDDTHVQALEQLCFIINSLPYKDEISTEDEIYLLPEEVAGYRQLWACASTKKLEVVPEIEPEKDAEMPADDDDDEEESEDVPMDKGKAKAPPAAEATPAVDPLTIPGSTEWMDNVTKILAKITFKEKYRQITQDNLVKFLDEFQINDDLDDTEPMYIPSARYLFDESSQFQFLSIFGALAPSFLNRGQKAKTIPLKGVEEQEVDVTSLVEEGAKGKKAKVRKGKKTASETSKVKQMVAVLPMPGPFFIVGAKGLAAAVDDLHTVYKKEQIRMDMSERAKGSRNHCFAGIAAKRLYNKLNEAMVGEKMENIDAPAAAPEAGSSKKKIVMMEDDWDLC